MSFRVILLLFLSLELHAAETVTTGTTVGVAPGNPGTEVVPFPPAVAVTERAITITLGGPVPMFAGVLPLLLPVQPPIAVPTGTRLKFVAAASTAIASVKWFRNSVQLTPTTATFEVALASEADTGVYSASVKLTNGDQVSTGSAAVFVTTRQSPRVINSSARVRLGPEQPSFISGFVVEAAPEVSGSLLLIRAVGPTLANFGVASPLAAPQLRVFDARGQEIAPVNTPIRYPTPAEAAQRTGAFALASGTKDVANVYHLPAGVYVAQVSSVDNGAGTVLFEIYEVAY